MDKAVQYKEQGAKFIEDKALLQKWNEKVDYAMQDATQDANSKIALAIPIAIELMEKAKLGAMTKDLVEFISQYNGNVYAKDLACSLAEQFSSNINGFCEYIQAYRYMKDCGDALRYPSKEDMASVDQYLASTKEYSVKAMDTAAMLNKPLAQLSGFEPDKIFIRNQRNGVDTWKQVDAKDLERFFKASKHVQGLDSMELKIVSGMMDLEDSNYFNKSIEERAKTWRQERIIPFKDINELHVSPHGGLTMVTSSLVMTSEKLISEAELRTKRLEQAERQADVADLIKRGQLIVDLEYGDNFQKLAMSAVGSYDKKYELHMCLSVVDALNRGVDCQEVFSSGGDPSRKQRPLPLHSPRCRRSQAFLHTHNSYIIYTVQGRKYAF
jgi:hypothetical protein